MNPNSREHLSALMDGELEGEPARFLLRRMEHEPELARAWSRWHLIRACLAGSQGNAAHTDAAGIVAAALKDDEAFAARVMQAVVQARPQARRHWARYIGGGAIAASVAAAALILAVPQMPSGTDAGIVVAPNRVTTIPPANVIAAAPVSVKANVASLPWLNNNRQPMFLAARQNAANAALGGGLLQSGYLQQAAYAPDAVPLSAPLLLRGTNQTGNAPYMILLVPDNGTASHSPRH
ncbi:MAG TPA: sigma-E factor negative regulatory protein [Rhodanobacteraceae bacterium]|nr:sigma-E factor negative regulatory protein [Rhodanobacteraceae bacterium]